MFFLRLTFFSSSSCNCRKGLCEIQTQWERWDCTLWFPLNNPTTHNRVCWCFVINTVITHHFLIIFHVWTKLESYPLSLSLSVIFVFYNGLSSSCPHMIHRSWINLKPFPIIVVWGRRPVFGLEILFDK